MFRDGDQLPRSKMYSDPEFFFHIWVEEMTKKMEIGMQQQQAPSDKEQMVSEFEGCAIDSVCIDISIVNKQLRAIFCSPPPVFL